MRRLCVCLIVMLASWPARAAQAPPPLTLAEAMARAVREQPSLQAGQLEVDARAAEVIQAGRWLNPSAAFETEDLGRSAALLGPSETTVTVTQRLELGDKRDRRSAAAIADRVVAERDVLVARHDLEGRVAAAYVRALAAQADVGLADQDATAAAESAAAIAARVDAGVAPPPDADRARAAAIAATIRLRTARQQLESARLGLAGTWAGSPDEATTLDGALSAPTIPALETLLEGIDSAPAVVRGQADMARARAGADMAGAVRVPDLDLTVGHRWLHDVPTHAWVIGANLSVPIFDRQGDRLTAASLRVTSADRAVEAARLSTRVMVAALHRAATDAAATVASFDTDLIPLHERVYSAVSEGYAAGRFGLLQLLDARQSLIEARRNRLSALEEMFQALVTLHATLGRTNDLAALTATGSSR